MRRLMVLIVLVVCFVLSGCDTIDKLTGEFNPQNAVVNGSISENGGLEERTYEGTGEVIRYSCQHTGKISLVIKPDNSFLMTVTTPTVKSNCQPGGDLETAKIYGSVDETSDVIHFSRCNQNSTPPEGLGNYTLKKAQGGVSCFDLNAANKNEKWLSVTFEVKRTIDGKVVD